jgi:hypothetical protein
MLVVVCVDSRMHLSTPSMSGFVGVHNIGIQDSCKFQFELNVSVGMERPVTEIRSCFGRGDTSNNRSWQR